MTTQVHYMLTLCFLVAAAIPLRAQVSSPPDQECSPPAVPYEQVRDAMRRHGDYSLTATMNMGLFAAEAMLGVARARAAMDSTGPITIRQDDWFRAYLEVAGIRPDEAPIGMRMAHQYGQDTELEFRRERVIASVEGREPVMAVAVRVYWPSGPNAADKYEYHDTLSTPRVKVSIKRVVTYYLLDFGDMIAYHQMEGVSGHPTSGALGKIFAVIGNARAEDSRIAVSPDGVQVAVVRGSKWGIPRTITGSVLPDGTGESGTRERRDLAELATRLKAPIRVEYVPRTRRGEEVGGMRNCKV